MTSQLHAAAWKVVRPLFRLKHTLHVNNVDYKSIVNFF